MKKSFILLLIISLLLVSCDSGTNSENNNNTVVVNTYKSTFEFNEVPSKVVSLNYAASEILAELDLQSKIVGMAEAHAKIDTCLPENQEKLKDIKTLGDLPAIEVVVENDADFVLGSVYSFTQYGVAPHEKFLDLKIPYYAQRGTYVVGSTVEDVYEDILNIARIFRVEDRAYEVINKMKARVKEASEKADPEKEYKVFVFDSGEEKAYTAGLALEANLIDLAGGKNIFNDIPRQFGAVSWEEIAKRNPDIIIVHNYANSEAEGKIEFLKKHPALKEVSAVKNNKFITVNLEDIFPGVKNVNVLEKWVEEFKK